MGLWLHCKNRELLDLIHHKLKRDHDQDNKEDDLLIRLDIFQIVTFIWISKYQLSLIHVALSGSMTICNKNILHFWN